MLVYIKFSLPLSYFTLSLCGQPPAVWWERPLVDSPRDLEEGFNRMHLCQWGISICQLDGSDAKRPHVTAGVVRVVILLFTGYDLQHNTTLTFRTTYLDD